MASAWVTHVKSFAQKHKIKYNEALKNAQEVLELLIESALNNNENLPKPNIFGQLLQLA